MKKVYQTLTGDKTGNCYPACIASLLHLEINKVPNFCLGDNPDWMTDANKYLGTVGFRNLYLDAKNSELSEIFNMINDVFYIVHGPTTRGTQHAVVYQNDKLAHDPMGADFCGILSVDIVELILPIDIGNTPTPSAEGE